ncbi:hypothetical protein HY745_04215, partial [Candidatus Desantisbacteria bacterium]|nr:hypothetical protein [Candidatus Desantisbacteria bacterium]
MKKNKINLIIITFILFFSGCDEVLIIKDGIILKGTNIWKGNIYIKGDVTVESGAKLIIQPGTKIFFEILNQQKILSEDELTKLGPYSPLSELIVAGTIEAKGTDKS